MRTYSERQIEQIWQDEVLLAEASVFAKYFQLPGKAMKTIHDDIGITADAVPERPISQPKEFDREGLKGVSWVRKHIDLRKIFEAGDGIFVVNPQTKTRVIIKQRIQDPYRQPDKRSVGHKPGKTIYTIWVFNDQGDLIREINRPMTGKKEIVRDAINGRLAKGNLIVLTEVTPGIFVKKGSEDDPTTRKYNIEDIKNAQQKGENIAVECDIKKEDSNMYVRYIDKNGARAFLIPNNAFRARRGEDYGFIGINDLMNKRVATPTMTTQDVGKMIVDKYGKVIADKIRAVLEPLKQGIIEVLSDLRINDKVVKELVDDYRRFLSLQNNITQLNLAYEIKKFLGQDVEVPTDLKKELGTIKIQQPGNLEKYNVEIKDNAIYFQDETSFNQFLRDFALAYIKSISSSSTEEKVVDSLEGVF